MLSQLTEARDTAQAELATAEIALLEATAGAVELREAVARLDSAVAALEGRAVPAEPVKEVISVETTPIEGEVTPNRAQAADISPEEFDKQRKRRQRKREKELQANNPLAHVKCAGCGEFGTLEDTMLQAPSGASVRMMVCRGCGNQIMQ